MAEVKETKEKKAALLDEEDDLSPAFAQALCQIFRRFSRSAQEHLPSSTTTTTSGDKQQQDQSLEKPSTVAKLTSTKEADAAPFDGIEKQIIMTEEELDNFTKIVNEGQVMNQSSKDEMKEYLDVDKDGNLTFTGFCEMYHLQSGSEPEETWKDLKALGYDDQLQLKKQE